MKNKIKKAKKKTYSCQRSICQHNESDGHSEEVSRRIDPQRVHCTTVSKRPKFYMRPVTRVDPYTLQGMSHPVPPALGEVPRHKQLVRSQFICSSLNCGSVLC